MKKNSCEFWIQKMDLHLKNLLSTTSLGWQNGGSWPGWIFTNHHWMYAEMAKRNIPLDVLCFNFEFLFFFWVDATWWAKHLTNLPSGLCAATRASGPGWENAVNDWRKQGRASGGSHSLGIQPITLYAHHAKKFVNNTGVCRDDTGQPLYHATLPSMELQKTQLQDFTSLWYTFHKISPKSTTLLYPRSSRHVTIAPAVAWTLVLIHHDVAHTETLQSRCEGQATLAASNDDHLGAVSMWGNTKCTEQNILRR